MDYLDSLRAVLRSQYHASLAMLGEAIEKCPEELWLDPRHRNACWQLAYHTLYFAHQYMMPTLESFVPWAEHVAEVQYDDAIAGTPNPDSGKPLLPEPYTREQCLRYWAFCDAMVDGAVEAMDLLSPTCGFHWYKLSKLEHQFVNIRHIQHGAAQLADRLRVARDVGVRWRGSAPSARPPA